MQVVTMAGTQGWGFILSDGSPGSNNLIQIQNFSYFTGYWPFYYLHTVKLASIKMIRNSILIINFK